MMSLLKSPSFILCAFLLASLVSLTACASAPDTPAESSAADSTAESASDTPAAPPETASASADDHSQPTKGGQVVEVGNYHLELVPLPEVEGIHLDLYLQTGDAHAAIANASVTAQVQLPDGTTQELPLEYDAAGEHYFAFLPSQTTGEYKVAILTDVNGEKANGRFTFMK
jgi:hypothetical protein